jgi:hypothetical protein
MSEYVNLSQQKNHQRFGGNFFLEASKEKDLQVKVMYGTECILMLPNQNKLLTSKINET